MNGNSLPAAERELDKKVYIAPELVEYGTVAQMTQSGSTVSANDGQTHRARRP